MKDQSGVRDPMWWVAPPPPPPPPNQSAYAKDWLVTPVKNMDVQGLNIIGVYVHALPWTDEDKHGIQHTATDMMKHHKSAR